MQVAPNTTAALFPQAKGKKITNDMIDQNIWSQRKDLVPPPYQGAFKSMLKGLDIGDPRVDALPMSRLCGHGGESHLEQDPEPEWVDWDMVKRGQDLWCDNMGRNFISLAVSLLAGFSIARFAEVLYANGYAQSAHTAFTRYSQTSFYILDWLRFPLNDPQSRSRKAIYNVRSMHAFARRRTIEKKMFNKEKGEGVPLSQYDMAEVQMAFSAVALSIMENEMGMQGKLTKEDKEAMTHVWRLIGYHLGIMDEFNVCTSFERNCELLDDWMKWTPHRLVTCRECTFELQRTAVEGFGQFTGIGEEFWIALLYKASDSRDWDIDFLRVRKPLPGMKEFSSEVLRGLGNNIVNKIVKEYLITLREKYITNPSFVRTFEKVAKVISRFHDAVIWRIFGIFTRISYLFGFTSPLATIFMIACVYFIRRNRLIRYM